MNQVMLETYYGDHAVKELLQLELKDMQEELKELEELILEYKTKDHYEVKNNAINQLMTSSKLIAEELAINTIGYTKSFPEVMGIIAVVIDNGLDKYNLLTIAADLIALGEGILYEIDEDLNITSMFTLDSETYEAIDTKMYIPPCVEHPFNWISNTEGGYHSKQSHIITGKGYNKHSANQAYDVLNLLQDIEWKLDTYILNYEEEPNKEFVSSDSQEQFTVFKEISKKIYKEYINKPFWYVWKYDKRGRQYMQGFK